MEHETFEPDADDEEHDRRDADRRDIGNTDSCEEEVGDVGAEHIQRTVSQVGNAQHSEHQGQTDRGQAVDAAQRKAVEELLDEEGHGESGPLQA